MSETKEAKIDVSKYKILNGPLSKDKPVNLKTADLVAEELNAMILSLYAEFIDDAGNIAYGEMAKSPAFDVYKKTVMKLHHMDLFQLSREQLMCFCLNIYNALVIHAMIDVGQPGIFSRTDFYSKNAYYIGPLPYSLDDIEHGILRGNQVHPTKGSTFFSEDDPRRHLALNPIDPRVHFALVCGAKSCPPIRIFRSNNLDQGLQLAAQGFCNRELHVDTRKRVVKTSKIFEWYGKDFAPTAHEQLVMIATKYLSSENPAKDELLQLLSQGPKKYSVVFEAYDWSLNGSM